MKSLNILVMTLAVMLISFQGVFGQNNSDSTQVADSSITLEAKVKGITCAHDLKTIAGNITKLNGVSSCEVVKKGPTSTYRISYDPKLVTKKEIIAAIEDTPGCKDPNDRPYKVKQ